MNVILILCVFTVSAITTVSTILPFLLALTMDSMTTRFTIQYVHREACERRSDEWNCGISVIRYMCTSRSLISL